MIRRNGIKEPFYINLFNKVWISFSWAEDKTWGFKSDGKEGCYSILIGCVFSDSSSLVVDGQAMVWHLHFICLKAVITIHRIKRV